MARFEILDDMPAGRYELIDEKPSEPFGKRLNREIGDFPRQVGLTARHGMNALGSTVGLLSDPIGGVINAATGSHLKTARGLSDSLADSLGLPRPANERERIVADATEMMGTSGTMAGTAKKAADVVTGPAKALFQTMGSRPLQQVVSGTAGGAAGGYTRETGGDETSQALAALTASVAAPLSMDATRGLANAGRRFVQNRLPVTPETISKIDITIDSALKPSGITMGDLPISVRNSIRNDVQQAMKTDGLLSPDAVKRLADYRIVGAQPRAGTLTLDPVMVTQERNLAKLGANSKDPAAQQLARVENANNRQLIEALNQLGANTSDDAFSGGQKIIGALDGRLKTAKSLIDQRYDQARATAGRNAELDPSHFTQTANNLLDEALLGGKLPGDVRNLLNKAALGEMPLTVDVAEQFKTRIGDLQRASMDKQERMALGLVRKALDDTPLLDGQGQQALDAFGKARRLNRAWESIVEKTPALQAVRDGVEPDKFVQTFIVGNGTNANTMDLAMLKRSVKGNPEAMDAIKGQITAYLKNAALNGNADEVGNFSQSGYNKALRAIGERKLGMFFTPEEVSQMKAVGRVASYEQFQPRGSAVNNSNTAGAALSSILDRFADSPLLSKIPMGQFLAGPAQNISVGMKANRALNIPRGLLLPQPASVGQPPAGLLMAPAALMQLDDNKEKRRSLLFP